MGMCYNSARYELFFADYGNDVLRTIRLQDNAGDLRDVFRRTAEDRTPRRVRSVCHMSNSDLMLVCSNEYWQNEWANWLVLLSREGSEWRETHRVQTAVEMCCALSDSRVLVGDYDSTYMELFRVQSDARIERVHCIDVSEKYRWQGCLCFKHDVLNICLKHSFKRMFKRSLFKTYYVLNIV